jgi:uncharacterized membrane protein YeiB
VSRTQPPTRRAVSSGDTMTHTIQPSPVGEGERIHALDALRGIALLGILMVNMAFFKRLSTLQQIPPAESLAQPIDQTAFLLIQALFTAKFYPIFAFLFGLGFALQMERLQARGVNPTGIMLRRLLVLLAIGALHGLFIWTGDVLLIYALSGMALLLFARLSSRAVLYWAMGLWGAQALCCLSCGGITLWWAAMGGSEAAGGDFFTAYIEQGRQAYAQPSYWVAQQFRFVEWLLMFLNAIFFLPNVLVMFLLGLYFGKQGVFGQLAAHRRLMGLLAWRGRSRGRRAERALCTGGLLKCRCATENELQSYAMANAWDCLRSCAGGGLYWRVRVALVGGRGAATRALDAHRRRGAHGAHQLLDAIGGLHPALLRLWAGAARQGRRGAGRIAHAPTVGCAGGRTARSGWRGMPVRTNGVALAQSNLRAARADASRSARYSPP